jgi:ketosteroid isomerase-like protein
MSQENVEAVRRSTDAFNADDIEGVIAECDPEIELHSRFTEMAGVYRGYVGLRMWQRDLHDAWEYLRLELERVIEVDDDSVVVLMTLYGKGRRSGAEIRQQVAHVDTLRAGKFTRIASHADRAEALEAVGLR